jgi:tetratricopeptide (TPR) repeat protein
MSSVELESLWLNDEAEAAWLRLRQHLDWSQGFALGFLFMASALAGVFRERLARVYQGRVSALQVVQPATPDAALQEVMQRVRAAMPVLDEIAAPLWIEVNQYSEDPTWEQGRALLLARLNEHRELLRRQLRRPVMLVLPAGYHKQVQQLAPDLWSIRDWSLTAASRLDQAQPAGRVVSAVVEFPSAADAVAEGAGEVTAVADDVDALVTEWRRLWDRRAHGADVLNIGWRALDLLLAWRRLEAAEEIAGQVLFLARRYAATDPRSLSVSLNWQGDVAQAQGRLEDAERAYRESLAVRRDLRGRLGDTPEVLRDLSISLERVGDLAVTRRQLPAAQQTYDEAAALLRRLDYVFPGREYARWLLQIETKRRELAGKADGA